MTALWICVGVLFAGIAAAAFAPEIDPPFSAKKAPAKEKDSFGKHRITFACGDIEDTNGPITKGKWYEVEGMNLTKTHFHHRNDLGELIWNKIEFFLQQGASVEKS